MYIYISLYEIIINFLIGKFPLLRKQEIDFRRFSFTRPSLHIINVKTTLSTIGRNVYTLCIFSRLTIRLFIWECKKAVEHAMVKFSIT